MQFDNSDKIISTLKERTGSEWEEISPVYLHFKTHYNTHGQFCVFASSDWARKGSFARFYIPKNGEDLYDPKLFLEYLKNEKTKIVKNMPWIKLDLATFPVKPYYAASPDGTTIVGAFSFQGDIKLRSLSSMNASTVDTGVIRHLTAEAQLAAGNILNSLQLDFKNNILSVSLSETNGHWTNSVQITPTTIEGSVTPPSLQFQYNKWEIHLNLTVTFSATISHDTPPPPAPQHSEFWKKLEVVGIAAVVALGFAALVVFTDGGALIGLGAT